MNRRHLHLTLALSACALALPTAAAAQPIPELGDLTDKQQKILLGHLDRGRTLYENGEFVDALDAFQDAYAIFPHPDVLYRVAECQEKMGEDADAIANYKKFLRQSPDAPERKRIEGVISVLERRLAKRQEARVYVRSEPPGARAYLGSVDLGPTPVGIPVTPGDYDIRVELEGYKKI
jgi:tetratricopeptide (TPR) repeat protein